MSSEDPMTGSWATKAAVDPTDTLLKHHWINYFLWQKKENVRKYSQSDFLVYGKDGLKNMFFFCFFFFWSITCITGCLQLFSASWCHLFPIRRREAGRGSVMLWAMFFWETLGPGVHVNLVWQIPMSLALLLTIFPFMEILFLDGCGLLQGDNALCHEPKMVQACSEEHKTESRYWFFPHFPLISHPSSLIQSTKQILFPPCKSQDFKFCC